MEQDSGIPVGLERRLEGLSALPGDVPGGVDLAVLRQAEGVLKRRRMAVAWGWSWKAGAVAAVLGVTVGLGAMAVGVGPRRGSGGGVDMVDALKAAKGGAPAAEVRRIAGAAVRVGQGGGL